MVREEIKTPTGAKLTRRGFILTTVTPALEGSTKAALVAFVDAAEKLKGSFFWSPPATAHGRRSYEERNSYPLFAFRFGQDEYTTEIKVSCSCRNIYVEKNITKNGARVDIRAIKKIIAALE
jgi:hypothetical protein